MGELGRWTTASPEETARAGAELSAMIPEGSVVQLTGNLGAGKTTLTKALVEAWGIAAPEDVSSPTFTLIHEYGEPVSVYHVDLYRLEEPREYYGLGMEELYDSGARVLIEWGEKFAALLPVPRLIVEMTHAGGDNRVITLRSISEDRR